MAQVNKMENQTTIYDYGNSSLATNTTKALVTQCPQCSYSSNSPVKNSFDLEQIATEIILGVLASQIHPD